ncbi:MAG: hypothetical protein Tsb009_08160 [Planctomycetaceae bacterium]
MGCGVNILDELAGQFENEGQKPDPHHLLQIRWEGQVQVAEFVDSVDTLNFSEALDQLMQVINVGAPPGALLLINLRGRYLQSALWSPLKEFCQKVSEERMVGLSELHPMWITWIAKSSDDLGNVKIWKKSEVVIQNWNKRSTSNQITSRKKHSTSDKVANRKSNQSKKRRQGSITDQLPKNKESLSSVHEDAERTIGTHNSSQKNGQHPAQLKAKRSWFKRKGKGKSAAADSESDSPPSLQTPAVEMDSPDLQAPPIPEELPSASTSGTEKTYASAVQAKLAKRRKDGPDRLQKYIQEVDEAEHPSQCQTSKASSYPGQPEGILAALFAWPKLTVITIAAIAGTILLTKPDPNNEVNGLEATRKLYEEYLKLEGTEAGREAKTALHKRTKKRLSPVIQQIATKGGSRSASQSALLVAMRKLIELTDPTIEEAEIKRTYHVFEKQFKIAQQE